MRQLDTYWEDCIISEDEKEILLKRYKEIYNETIKTSNFLNDNEHYPWSIISGYYSMFYKALVLLAEKHNLKPKSFESHSQVISALHVLYSKKQISELMDIAYHKVKHENLPGNLLYKAKDKRNKINYITNTKNKLPQKKECEIFIIDVRDKFLNTINELLKERLEK